MVDAQFAFDLAAYGKSQSKFNFKSGTIAFGSGAFIGFLFSTFDQSLVLFNFSVFFILLSIAYTTSLSVSLVKTFCLHDYDQVWRDFNKTLFWCQSWAPFSYPQLRMITLIQNETLIKQGRYAELEAVTRIQWANDERDANFLGVPKKAEIADLLAISFMGQRKFDQAIEIFESLRKSTKQKHFLKGVLHSLAYCYLELGENEKAINLLEENEKAMSFKQPLNLTLEQDLVRVRLELVRKNLDFATAKMNELSTYSRNSRVSPEFRAHYFRTLSCVREAQGRFEEAELHLQTAIDIIRSAPSLNSLSLSETYDQYAQFLKRNGNIDLALCMTNQSEDFENDYLQKQLARLDDIRRLISRKSRYPVSMTRLLCESA